MAQKPVLRGEVGCACVAREVSVERGGCKLRKQGDECTAWSTGGPGGALSNHRVRAVLSGNWRAEATNAPSHGILLARSRKLSAQQLSDLIAQLFIALPPHVIERPAPPARSNLTSDTWSLNAAISSEKTPSLGPTWLTPMPSAARSSCTSAAWPFCAASIFGNAPFHGSTCFTPMPSAARSSSTTAAWPFPAAISSRNAPFLGFTYFTLISVRAYAPPSAAPGPPVKTGSVFVASRGAIKAQLRRSISPPARFGFERDLI